MIENKNKEKKRKKEERRCGREKKFISYIDSNIYLNHLNIGVLISSGSTCRKRPEKEKYGKSYRVKSREWEKESVGIVKEILKWMLLGDKWKKKKNLQVKLQGADW